MIRELILQMKLGHVHRAYSEASSGSTFSSDLPLPERAAGSRLPGAMTKAMCGWNRNGWVAVSDRLLSEFFLPQHSQRGYA